MMKVFLTFAMRPIRLFIHLLFHSSFNMPRSKQMMLEARRTHQYPRHSPFPIHQSSPIIPSIPFAHFSNFIHFIQCIRPSIHPSRSVHSSKQVHPSIHPSKPSRPFIEWLLAIGKQVKPRTCEIIKAKRQMASKRAAASVSHVKIKDRF